MFRDVKQSLARALRLGGYAQTRDFLKRKNRFCALGVLCELYRLNTGDGEWVGPFEGKNNVQDAYCYQTDNGEWSTELPSQTILQWAGITEDFAMRIYKLNDIERQTFAGIANFVEAS